MKAALALCLMLTCTVVIAEPHSLQNSDVKTVKAELTKIHKGVKSRFIYEKPKGEETFKYYTSYERVYGDCDDFVSAAYYELWKAGANPKIYTYDNDSVEGQYRHVIVCALGFCLDNNNKRIISYETFMGKVGKTIELVEGGSGQLNEERMLALRETELIILGENDEHI